mgnify:CR=1 FL=1
MNTKKFIKAITATTVAIAMSMSLVACSGDGDAAETSGTAATTTEAVIETTEAVETTEAAIVYTADNIFDDIETYEGGAEISDEDMLCELENDGIKVRIPKNDLNKDMEYVFNMDYTYQVTSYESDYSVTLIYSLYPVDTEYYPTMGEFIKQDPDELYAIEGVIIKDSGVYTTTAGDSFYYDTRDYTSDAFEYYPDNLNSLTAYIPVDETHFISINVSYQGLTSDVDAPMPDINDYGEYFGLSDLQVIR